MVILAVLTLLAAACEPEKEVAPPTPSSPVPTHVDLENFNDVVLTGGRRSADAGFSGSYMLQATIDGKPIAGTITWYRRGTRVRADFFGTANKQDVEVEVISGPNYPTDDVLYVCQPGEQTCTEAHPAESGDDPVELLPSLVAFQLLDVGNFATGLNFYDESTRTIVEQPALCFVGRAAAVPADAIDHGEVCLTQDGLPLLVTASSEGKTVSLTAVKVPGSVNEKDFDLPSGGQ